MARRVVFFGTERDKLPRTRWGGVVHIITAEGITTKYLKGRMD